MGDEMMKDKESLPIASNPSNADYPALLNLARMYRGAYGLMKTLGLTSTKLDDLAAAADRALEFESVLTLPDRFNALFAERGWIATSSLGIDVMEDALRLGARGDLNAAEELLAGWFDEEKLRIFAILRSRRFHRVPEREEQLEEAIRLHHEGRYWSALPLILIAADGFASDVAGYSAFKEGADLSAFDSVVGHPTSLPNLIRAVTRTRRKSTAEPVPLPYRHGILHGQDLGYADRVTCAKGWMLFVALVDWAIDKQSESERRKKDDERRSFTWQKAIESMQRNKATRDALDAWTPREVAAPLPEPLDPASPEAALLSYLEYWKAGTMAVWGSSRSISSATHQESLPVRQDRRLVPCS